MSVRVLPATVFAHAGLAGSFVILEFAKDTPVVHVEARTTGLFRDDPSEVAHYKLTVKRLTEAALDPERSVALMKSIAADFDTE